MAIIYSLAFTAANDTDIDTLSPSVGASGVTPLSGTSPRVTNNRARRRVTSVTEANYVTQESGGLATADYIVHRTLRRLAAGLGDNDFFRIYGRVVDASNLYRVTWFQGTFFLQKVIAGSSTTLGSATWSPTLNTDYIVSLACNGTALSVLVDASEVIPPVTDSDLSSAGQAGGTFNGSDGDDVTTTGWHESLFQVESFASGPSAAAIDDYLRLNGLIP